MVTNWVYELPGRNLSGPAKHVIGGWQLNGILSLASGFPFTIGQGAGDLSLPNGAARPDQISNPELSGPNRKLWYNTLRGPGERRVDFSMFKNFVITERVQLQFRGLVTRMASASPMPTRSPPTAAGMAKFAAFGTRCGACSSG